MNRPLAVGLVAAITLAGGNVGGQNVDEMVKWTSAEIVHYDVVAEYAGSARVAVLPKGSTVTSYSTQVTDRFEIGFDWNPGEMAMVGTATFKNFPSTMPSGLPAVTMLGQKCPPPKINAGFDHVEIIGAKTGMMGSNGLELTFKRTYAGGSISYANEYGCAWAEATATTETVTQGLVVPPGMFLAMPGAGGANMTVGKDGKTLIVDDKGTNWKYTYTLRIVK